MGETIRQRRINRIRLEFKAAHAGARPSHAEWVLIESDWNLKLMQIKTSR